MLISVKMRLWKRLRELPELRHQRGAEERAIAELVEELEGGEDAVEDEGRAAVVALDLEPGLGADGVGEVEVLPLGAEEEVDVELVGLEMPSVPRKPATRALSGSALEVIE